MYIWHPFGFSGIRHQGHALEKLFLKFELECSHKSKFSPSKFCRVTFHGLQFLHEFEFMILKLSLEPLKLVPFKVITLNENRLSYVLWHRGSHDGAFSLQIV